MSVTDHNLSGNDKAYRSAQTDVVIAGRDVKIHYKKSYGGMSPYFKGIMGGENARLLFSVCGNTEGHDRPQTLRFQVPRADCPECYAATRWEALPGDTRFLVETLSTAVELAGVSFMDQLPVTVAWIKAVLPDAVGTELDTLAAGMVRSHDYALLRKGDELRPVFRLQPQANASDVLWILKTSAAGDLPAGYVHSKNYTPQDERVENLKP